MTAQPLVSVVIPVYNAAGHLDECLRSIAEQSLGPDRVEVVAVDDGSTDRSGELLEEWADRHPGRVRVLHQPNSGAPGGPRNRGIEAAEGEYVFFADPDDYLGAEALERMVAAAERNGSDVVLGRIKGVGRAAPTGPFRGGNVEGGDIHSTRAVWSLTAHKLFRRSLLVREKLRFAEGVRLAEEQPLVVPAYFLARSISVVADYDCYHLVHRPGFAHLTRQVPDPEPFYGVVREALRTVVAHTGPGERRDALLRRWAEVELLNRFRGQFPSWPRERQLGYTEAAGELMAEFITPGALAARPPLDHLRAALLRERRVEDLVRLARFEYGDAAVGGGGSAVLELPRGGRRLAVSINTGVRLPAGVRVSDLLTGAHPSATMLSFQAVLPVPSSVGRTEPRLRLSLPGGGVGQDLAIRVRGHRLPRRRLRVCGGRLRLVWVGRAQDGTAVLHVGGWRALLGAARRKLLR